MSSLAKPLPIREADILIQFAITFLTECESHKKMEKYYWECYWHMWIYWTWYWIIITIIYTF